MKDYSKDDVAAVVSCPKTGMTLCVPRHRIKDLYHIITKTVKKTQSELNVTLGHKAFSWCSEYRNRMFWFINPTLKDISNLNTWELLKCRAVVENKHVIFKVSSVIE